MAKFTGDWRKFASKDHLGSWDIEDYPNKTVNLTIIRVELKNVVSEKGTSLCRIAHFKEQEFKPMILNSGNTKIFEKFVRSKRVEDWANINVPVTIYVKNEYMRMLKENIDCLRLKPTQPNQPKPELKVGTQVYSNVLKGYKEGYTIEQIKAKYNLTPEVEKQLKDDATK